jgi:hypothetical protein
MNDLYKIIHIPNLEEVAVECYKVIHEAGIPIINDLYTLDKDLDDRFRYLPTLKKTMIELGLYDVWFRSAVVVTYDDLPIHTDSADDFCFSFNIPIKNTKNTYTVFYETLDDPKIMSTLDGYTYGYIKYDPKTVKVLDKLEMINAAIINTQVAHNVVHQSIDLPRINLLLRLSPSFKIDDYSFN